jgi:hypothetical protein
MVEKEKQIKLVLQKYPFLKYNKERGILFGTIDSDDNDFYEIEISQLNHFPNKFPMVKETGERIPKKEDRHIYENTLSCCFTTRAREQILLKTHVKKLIDFFDLIVIPYFQNNSYYEINGEYSQGEYSHGLGNLEGYIDILGIDDVKKVFDLLEFVTTKGFILKPTNKCYCGNGLKLKSCKHRKNYKRLKYINLEIIRSDFIIIKRRLKQILFEK